VAAALGELTNFSVAEPDEETFQSTAIMAAAKAAEARTFLRFAQENQADSAGSDVDATDREADALASADCLGNLYDAAAQIGGSSNAQQENSEELEMEYLGIVHESMVMSESISNASTVFEGASIFKQLLALNLNFGAGNDVNQINCYPSVLRFRASLHLAIAEHAKQLRSKFQERLASLILRMHWPRTDGSTYVFLSDPDSPEAVEFERTCFHLAKLQSQCRAQDQAKLQSLWVVDILLAPVVERFAFHFCRGALAEEKASTPLQTTVKPKWHTDFLLRCARSARIFLVETIQPILAKSGLTDCAAFGFFLRGLVSLAREKLAAYFADEVYGMNDDAVICQVIDETLLFEQALHEEFSYFAFSASCPFAHWPRAIDLVAHYAFPRWVHIDAQAAEAKFLEISKAVNAWDICPWSQREGNAKARMPTLRPIRFAASFISMLHAITERFRLLTSRNQQRYIVDAIQKPLLVEFREALHRERLSLKGGFTQANCVTLCRILESLQCLCVALQDLSGDLVYTEMQSSDLSHYAEHELTSLEAGPAVATAVETVSCKSTVHAAEAKMWGHLGPVERDTQTMYHSMLVDVSRNIEVKFEHFTRGYAPWLVGSTSTSDEAIDDVSPHFRFVVGWMRGFLGTALCSVGQTTYNSLGRAASRTLNACAIALVHKLDAVSHKMGAQLHTDFIFMMNALVNDSDFSSPIETYFSGLTEVSRLLSLSSKQLQSLLESSAQLLGHGSCPNNRLDQQSHTHVEAMLATHGIHETPQHDAIRILWKRARV
jgi:hypothetical protein